MRNDGSLLVLSFLYTSLRDKLQIRKYSRSTWRWAKQIFRHKLRAEPSTKTFYDCLSSTLLEQLQIISWRRLKSFCFTNDLLFILSQFMRKLRTKMINYHFRVKVRPPTLPHEIFDSIHIWMNTIWYTTPKFLHGSKARSRLFPFFETGACGKFSHTSHDAEGFEINIYAMEI